MPAPPLSAKLSRELYWQLASMEKAGMPPEVAFGQFTKADKPLRQRAEAARKHIQKGATVARAGRLAGLFAEFDAELLKTAEAAGKLAEVYVSLAGFYEEKVRFWQQVKAKSLMPVFVFSLALFVNPLPDLILQRIDAVQYLRQTLGVLAAIAFGAAFAWRLRALIRLRPVEYLQMRVPVFRDWYIRRQMKTYYYALALMLAAGLSLFAALPKARNAVPNSLLRKRLQTIERGAQQNLRFHEALAKLPGVAPNAVQLIKSGEMSGTLDGALSQYVALEAEAIGLQNALLAEWLPRLLYWLVLASMAKALIIGDGPPPIPPDL